MKNAIISEKAREEKILLGGIANTTTLAKVARASISVDLGRRYNWAMSNIDLDAAKELELNNIK